MLNSIFLMAFLNGIAFLCFLLVLLLFENYDKIFQNFDNFFEFTLKVWKFAIFLGVIAYSQTFEQVVV